MPDSRAQAAEQDGEPYRNLCQAMSEGLLITVNCSDPSVVGIDEMAVQTVDEYGEVSLTAWTDDRFLLKHDCPSHDGPCIKETSQSEFSQIHEAVTTIEVVGVE